MIPATKIPKNEPGNPLNSISADSAIQPKLNVSRSNDKYEKEAHTVADRVIMMPSSTAVDTLMAGHMDGGQMNPHPGVPQVQAKCEKCQEEDSSEIIQMKTEPVIQRSTGDTGGIPDTDELADTGELIALCGPDVTDPLLGAAARVRQHFAGLSDTEKKESCYTLIHLAPSAAYAWDINELQYKGIGWITDYQPDAAVGGEAEGKQNIPRCEASVTVGGSCHMPNTVNYYIYGVMCKECYNYLNSLPDVITPAPAAPEVEEQASPPPLTREGVEHPESMTPEEFIQAHTGSIFVDAGSLGSDLLLLAALGEDHFDFIKDVMNELFSVTQDNVAWAFFESASDETLISIASTQAGYDLIMYMWNMMTGGIPTELGQRWRLFWLISEPFDPEENIDTGVIMDPRDTEDTGNSEEGCLFADAPAETLSKKDAPRFSLENMLCIIQYYKDAMYGGARAEQSMDWAAAGHNGSDGGEVAGDANRIECDPSDIPYDGDDFTLVWKPHLDE